MQPQDINVKLPKTSWDPGQLSQQSDYDMGWTIHSSLKRADQLHSPLSLPSPWIKWQGREAVTTPTPIQCWGYEWVHLALLPNCFHDNHRWLYFYLYGYMKLPTRTEHLMGSSPLNSDARGPSTGPWCPLDWCPSHGSPVSFSRIQLRVFYRTSYRT
jgi:hypothetical protein